MIVSIDARTAVRHPIVRARSLRRAGYDRAPRYRFSCHGRSAMFRVFALALAVLVCAPEVYAQEGEGRPDGERRRGRRGRDRDTNSVVLTHVTYQRVPLETTNLKSGSTNYGLYLPKEYADPANAE